MTALLAFVAVVTACGGGNAANGGGVLITPLGSPTPLAQATAASASTATAPANDGAVELRGFAYPVADACLPKGDQLMPNATRAYRNGIHEGVDFYPSDGCVAIGRGTAVLAAKAGRVVRADLDYRDLTQAELDQYVSNPNTEQALDKFRGRQVWIDHGGGVVSRYAHLDAIAAGIALGAQVTRGQLIAYVGESGTPESITNPGREYHLHFELRVGASYLGKGLSPADVRRLYETLFSP